MFFGTQKNKNIQKKILVISNSRDRLSLISDYLSVRGIQVKTYQCDFREFSCEEQENSLEAVIIDLGDMRQIQDKIDLICKIIPAGIVRIVFANNDSIMTKQFFLDKGIGYLHFDTQLQQLYTEIEHFKTHHIKSNAINIGILGTKGGVGTSFISYHIAQMIYQRYKTKTLLIQGMYSSFNLDLLSNREFEEKDFKEGDLYLMKEKDKETLSKMELSQYSFNFIVYDHSIHCMHKDHIEQVLNSSDCIVLLMSCDLSSIRKTKEILATNDFLLSVNQGAKKIVIALNATTSGKTLGKGEVEEILGKEIDCLIPFNHHKEELKHMITTKTKKELEKLVSMIIGSSYNKNRKIKRFFKGFL